MSALQTYLLPNGVFSERLPDLYHSVFDPQGMVTVSPLTLQSCQGSLGVHYLPFGEIDPQFSCNMRIQLYILADFIFAKLSAGGGCELAAITRCKCAWGKFRQLLPLLTNRHLPLLTRGKVYSSCVRSVMLHAAETWAMKVDTLNRLRRNDRAMIRWICNVRAKDEVSSDSLLAKLGIQDLDVVLRTSRMRWFGHVERSTGWIAEVRKLNVVA